MYGEVFWQLVLHVYMYTNTLCTAFLNNLLLPLSLLSKISNYF